MSLNFVEFIYLFFSKHVFTFSFKNSYWFVYWKFIFLLSNSFFLSQDFLLNIKHLYFSSSTKNQRFFFIMKSLFSTYCSFSVGSVLKKNNILEKHLRNSNQGLLFFFKFILSTLQNSSFFLFFFYGFVTKFFFFL